ncbi:MAG: type II toxin-antitoxin system VapC family toxin [bacterium]
MKSAVRDVFADTAFWIGLVVKQDQFHDQAQRWSLRITGRITTTAAVLLETANALSRPAWRAHGVALIEHLQRRADVNVIEFSSDLWRRGWDLYRQRPDKDWSLTDCISFEAMQDAKLVDALTTDDDYRQAGFRALLLEDS